MQRAGQIEREQAACFGDGDGHDDIDDVDDVDYTDYVDYGAATDYAADFDCVDYAAATDYATATEGEASKRTNSEEIAPSHERVESIPPSTERRHVGEHVETVVINVTSVINLQCRHQR